LQPRPPQESLPAAQPSSLPGAAGQSALASEVHRPSLLPLSHSQRRPANLEPADWESASAVDVRRSPIPPSDLGTLTQGSCLPLPSFGGVSYPKGWPRGGLSPYPEAVVTSDGLVDVYRVGGGHGRGP
jgi:hypothetical protein